MTNLKEIYKCNLCGNIIDVSHAAGGTLVCCGQDMTLIKENTEEASTEKHIPIIEKTKNNTIIKVGSINHPMDDNHYIEWIEAEIDNQQIRQYLNPGEAPQMTINHNDIIITKASAYCNIHGLWTTK